MQSAQNRGWAILAYLDLDGFKHLNDQDGHIAGDQCLKIFAERIRKLIRSKDTFARIGGDEFLIHMDIKNEAAARQVALRLQLTLNSVPTDAGRRLPCSIGLLILPPGPRQIDSEVRLADHLMYEAKQSGASIAVGTGRLRNNDLELDRHPDFDLSSADDGSGTIGQPGSRSAIKDRQAAA
jgi:diguanylate cyclase (GGDEF)-like protein